LDLKGKPCSIHPFSTDGIVLSGSADIKVVARIFQTAVEDELEKAGLKVRRAGSADASAPGGRIAITGRFTTVTAGNRLKRYFAPFMAGAPAIVEVEGTVADRDIPLDKFTAVGQRGLGSFGGASPKMLESAARVAGEQAARRAIAILTD
jgi:hypothetical protein